MYSGPIIDVDVHHRWKSDVDMLAYLEPEWRELADRERNEVWLEAPIALFHHSTGWNKRSDTVPEAGGPPGSDYELLCEQWLDPYPVERAILTFDVGTNAGIPNPMFASALCRAANDWNIDTWLDGHNDPRLYGSILVPTQLPEDGAAEIYRHAGNPRMVQALVVSNGLGKPFGHPIYHPIYAAAAECDLPIAIHNGGDQWGLTTHMTAGGMPATRFEFHTLAPQSGLTHLASFITNGVFEKFPNLRLSMIEIGVSWLPWLLWQLDRYYPELKKESPLLKKLPSEYFREHITVTTQPLEMTDRREDLIEGLEAADGIEDILVFSSDYPHWDFDDPTFVARRLPASWAPKVFYENGLRMLRWPANAKTLELASAQAEE